MTANAILAIRNLLSPSAQSKERNTCIRGKRGDAEMNSSNVESSNHNNSATGGGSNRSDDDSQAIDANSLLPRYLFPLVRHYHDDFYVSRSFDPRLVVQLMAEGFLPIATRGYLLPKLHVERCVLQLNPQSNLHVSKSTRRKSKSFLLSINECFDRVVAGCHTQHGTNWLYPAIVSAFRAIHQRTKGLNSEGVNAMVISQDSLEPHDTTPVRLYSVEIWNAETGNLAGGELGYSVGGIYSSLTGFSNEDASGSVQLGKGEPAWTTTAFFFQSLSHVSFGKYTVALGKLLTHAGFDYWDLGMALEYKTRLGAELISRADFVSKVKLSRIENKGVELRCGGSRRNAKEILDWELPESEVMIVTPRNGKSKQDQNDDVSQPISDRRKGNASSNRKRPHEEGKPP